MIFKAASDPSHSVILCLVLEMKHYTSLLFCRAFSLGGLRKCLTLSKDVRAILAALF